jgi:hypothetical protein
LLLPGPPPASLNAGPTVSASAKPANTLATTLRRESFTRFPPFRPQISTHHLNRVRVTPNQPQPIKLLHRLKSMIAFGALTTKPLVTNLKDGSFAAELALGERIGVDEFRLCN